MPLTHETHSTSDHSSGVNYWERYSSDPQIRDGHLKERVGTMLSQLGRMIGSAICKKNTQEIHRRMEKELWQKTPLVRKFASSEFAA